MIKYTVANLDEVVASLDAICEQGKEVTGINLKRVTSRDAACLNINDRAFYRAFELYEVVRNVVDPICVVRRSF